MKSFTYTDAHTLPVSGRRVGRRAWFYRGQVNCPKCGVSNVLFLEKYAAHDWRCVLCIK